MARVDADSPASRTALGAARHRAVHQLLEGGSILEDPLAVRVCGDDPDDLVARARERGDHRMRWFVCARSRFAEQVLAEATAAGVDQLVVLGAGLDTFAYRNPYDGLRVVEVDHPATRAWKLERLAEAAIGIPDTVVHAAVDFEQQDFREVLDASLDLDRPVLFWWLGVTPYLTGPAVESTLGRIGGLRSSAVVLDHATPGGRRRRDGRADAAAAGGGGATRRALGERVRLPGARRARAPVRLHRGEAGGRGCDDPPLPGSDAPRRSGPAAAVAPRPGHP